MDTNHNVHMEVRRQLCEAGYLFVFYIASAPLISFSKRSPDFLIYLKPWLHYEIFVSKINKNFVYISNYHQRKNIGNRKEK